MIAVDTNVLVRFLVSDDPAQAALAAAALDACSIEDPAFVSREVAIELFWVLERVYGLSRNDTAETLANLLRASRIAFENAHRVAAALSGTLASGLDFADQLIAFAARDQGASTTLTFDKRAAKIEGMTLLA